MSLHYVVKRLTNQHSYSSVPFLGEELNERLRDRNLEIWRKENRYIVTKGYTSVAQLNDWLHDQIVISFIYDAIPAHSRNNLYFLLVLDFKKEKNQKLVWKINEIEKNDRVCRKYVVEENKDLKRVPVLNNNFRESNTESIIFEEKFKSKLFNHEDIISKYGEMTQTVKDIVEVYFETYDEKEKGDEEKKIMIDRIITAGSEIE